MNFFSLFFHLRLALFTFFKLTRPYKASGEPCLSPLFCSEPSSSFQLFGIELINKSNVTTPDKAPSHPESVTSATTKGLNPTTVSGTDSDKKSNLSKVSKEQKQSSLQVSLKEIQSK
uniref:Uncharacterized protein n=1 Tax=Nelumbo nucifera TaxID=4432 RepID=A0A822ZI39_NELNU|nr:TPA_asm: hypothetical protein HUJ06_004004 [Nelumbo nucifera]